MKQFNSYGYYSAEYCRSTGLPMFDHSNYGEASKTYISKTRCAKLGVPVEENEQPAAFYRVQHGYAGLYKRK